MRISPLNYCKALGKCELWCYVYMRVEGDSKDEELAELLGRGQVSMSITEH